MKADVPWQLSLVNVLETQARRKVVIIISDNFSDGYNLNSISQKRDGCMSNYAVLSNNTTHDCSEACNCTRPKLHT